LLALLVRWSALQVVLQVGPVAQQGLAHVLAESGQLQLPAEGQHCLQ
jgi:hypothetical protein